MKNKIRLIKACIKHAEKLNRDAAIKIEAANTFLKKAMRHIEEDLQDGK